MKNTENKELIDIRQILMKYLQHWRWIALSVFMCLCIGVLYYKLTNPVYSVSANVLIKEDDSKGTMGSSALKNFAFGMGGGSDVDDEIHVISSHTTAARAVKHLGLNVTYKEKFLLLLKEDKYKDAAFILRPDVTDMADSLSKGITFTIKVSDSGRIAVKGKSDKVKLIDTEFTSFPCQIKTALGAFTLDTTKYYKPGQSYNYAISFSGYDAVAEEILKDVQINMVSKKANVIGLSLNTDNVKRGKDILNTIIEIYNKEAIEDKNIVANHTAKFLGDRLSIITQELDSIEQKVESYKNVNQFFDVEAESKVMLEQNADFTSKLVEIETQLNVVDLLLGYLQSKGGEYLLVPTTLGVTDKAVVESIQEYNKLLLERLKLLQNTHAKNPVVVALDAQIAVSRTNVLKSINNLKEGLGIASRQIKNQERKFTSKYNQAPRIEREFLDIKRRQLLKEQLYLFLMQKNEENALTLAVTAPKAKIIDQAYNLSEPVAPKRSMILGIALFLGIFIPIGIIYLLELLKVHFSSKDELEKLTNLSVIGEICQNKSEERVVVRDGENSSIAELFRLIRTNIQFILPRKDQKVILITSTVSGEGKSFFSINFALSLALLKKRVVLVGLDIRNPKLVEYLNMEDHIGITNYLASEDLTPEDIAVHSSQSGDMDIIIAGPVPPNPSELLLSDRLDVLFEYLRDHYDYIIVDTAPVGMVSDTFALNRIADATLYVCRANYSRRENIKFAEKVVREGKLKKVSLVINGTDAKQGYGYGYGYGYGRK